MLEGLELQHIVLFDENHIVPSALCWNFFTVNISKFLKIVYPDASEKANNGFLL